MERSARLCLRRDNKGCGSGLRSERVVQTKVASEESGNRHVISRNACFPNVRRYLMTDHCHGCG